MSQSTHEAQVEFLAQEAIGESPSFAASEKLDVEVVVTEEMISKRRARFQKMIIETQREHIRASTHAYTTRQGTRKELEVFECDTTVFYMEDQPNEPQYTASATETRGGTARSSDDA